MIIKKQIIQIRLADASIDLFGMIACISRVDERIRRKGAENCPKQIIFCNTFCEQAWRRVRRNLLTIDKNDDDNMMKIADFIIEDGEYRV